MPNPFPTAFNGDATNTNLCGRTMSSNRRKVGMVSGKSCSSSGLSDGISCGIDTPRASSGQETDRRRLPLDRDRKVGTYDRLTSLVDALQ